MQRSLQRHLMALRVPQYKVMIHSCQTPRKVLWQTLIILTKAWVMTGLIWVTTMQA